jgi:hypothetical protein
MKPDIDILKMAKKLLREEELSFENGWKQKDKIFKSKKTFKRIKKLKLENDT